MLLMASRGLGKLLLLHLQLQQSQHMIKHNHHFLLLCPLPFHYPKPLAEEIWRAPDATVQSAYFLRCMFYLFVDLYQLRTELFGLLLLYGAKAAQT